MCREVARGRLSEPAVLKINPRLERMGAASVGDVVGAGDVRS